MPRGRDKWAIRVHEQLGPKLSARMWEVSIGHMQRREQLAPASPGFGAVHKMDKKIRAHSVWDITPFHFDTLTTCQASLYDNG